MIERRQHRRILTLKNLRWVLGVVAVFLLVVSFDFSTRGKSTADYGKLYRDHIKRTEDVKPRPPIVVEAPAVHDQIAADPLLLAPAAREQEFLSTTEHRPVAMGTVATVPVVTRGSSGGVNIVGDSGGVVIVRGGDNAKRPVLAGGIFKQP
jgi:hypothetical protein